MTKSKTFTDAEIKKRIARLSQELAELQALVPSVNHGQKPPRMSQWVVIREYLQTVGGRDTPQNIAEALTDAGHDIGKYPLRNVKICVTSPFVKDVFRVVKEKDGTEYVVLTKTQIQYSPLTHRSKLR